MMGDEIKERIIQFLSKNGNNKTNSLFISYVLSIDHEKVFKIMKNILTEGENMKYEEVINNWVLTDEALLLISSSSLDFFQSNGLFEIETAHTNKKNKRFNEQISHLYEIYMGNERYLPEKVLKDYFHQNLIKNKNYKLIFLQKELFFEKDCKFSWEDELSPYYNFDMKADKIESGHLNLVSQMRIQFRYQLLQMGFYELHDCDFVNSKFWNLYSLFRPEEFVNSVNLFTNNELNIGFMNSTKSEINLLCNPNGSIIRKLNEFSNISFKPSRYFSFVKIFKKHSVKYLDCTEFHQYEGVLVDYDITLGNILGFVIKVLNENGLKTIEMRPFRVENLKPNICLLCYHEELDEWLEIGSCGMIHPQIVSSLKLPQHVNIGFFRLTLETMLMIQQEILNAKEFIGPLIDLELVTNSSIILNVK